MLTCFTEEAAEASAHTGSQSPVLLAPEPFQQEKMQAPESQSHVLPDRDRSGDATLQAACASSRAQHILRAKEMRTQWAQL